MKTGLILFILCFITTPGFCQDIKVDYGVASALWNQDLGNHRAEISKEVEAKLALGEGNK